MTRLTTLETNLKSRLGEDAELTRAFGELTLQVPADQRIDSCGTLRDEADLRFETCIDLCAVDYSGWRTITYTEAAQKFPLRFAVVIHLLSLTQNWRRRVRTFVPDDEFPLLPTVCDVWPSVNWFEREAFDLYGVVFEGHPDLRRILTDYGFIGHPFRKDFPISGYVEMRYDPEQKRVVYQPVTIEPREIVPRVVREDDYGIGR